MDLHFGCQLDWNALGTWAGSIGTVGTLGFMAHQWFELRVAKEREQARQVCFWVHADGHREGLGALFVQNASQEPVFGLSIAYEVRDHKKDPMLIGPKTFVHFGPNHTEQVSSALVYPRSVTMHFMDSAGVYWHRRWDGRLTKTGTQGGQGKPDQNPTLKAATP